MSSIFSSNSEESDNDDKMDHDDFMEFVTTLSLKDCCNLQQSLKVMSLKSKHIYYI